MNTAQLSNNPFVICKAAAGSGKTFTLVKEYLTLAMDVGSAAVRSDPQRFESALSTRFAGILAITFTKKATGEMKERILESLRLIALHGTDPRLSPMGAALLERLNGLQCYAARPVGEEELRWMAGVVHHAVLHNYSDLSVSTIDSFMHRVVRTFAHDLGKPVNFDVSLDQQDLIIHAVDRLMAQLGTEGHDDLTGVARAFADSNMDEGAKFNIEYELKKLAEQLFAEGADKYIDPVSKLGMGDFVLIHDGLAAENRRFSDSVTGQAAQLVELLDGLAPSADCFAGGYRGYYTFLRGIADGKLRPFTKTAAASLDQEKYTSAKCPKDVAENINAAADRIQDIYMGLREMLGVDSGAEMDRSAALRDYFTRKAVLANIFPLALLGRLGAELKAYAGENEVMHLSEFNKLINDVVREQPAPFIYERLGNRYHHYLIDEFQDTSVLQWHNLLPLLENGVSQWRESLVVGDGKQAIYRFRQGDVRQFVSLPHVDGDGPHGGLLAQQGYWREEPLSVNYRTASSVVRFNNSFFSWLVQQSPFAANKLVQNIYVGRDGDMEHPELEQHVAPSKEGVAGHVGVAFVDRNDPDAANEQVRKTIVRLVKEQGYSLKDIMILCRTKVELARVSDYLQSHSDGLEIKVTSTESFFMVRSHAVMALVAALRLLRDGADRVAAADLLQRLFNLGLTASPHREAFLAKGPVDVAAVLRAEGLEFDTPTLVRLGLYECCEELLRELHFDGFDVAYVASFLAQAADFAQRTHDGIGPFLEWFDDNATADTSDTHHKHLSAACSDSVDAVRLLTIHKAKGLEAPVVILPMGNWRVHGFSRWVDLGSSVSVDGHTLPAARVSLGKDQSTAFDGVRDEEEMLDEVDRINLLYVAFTRPTEQLFIVSPTPAEKGSTDGVNFPRMLKEFMDSKKPDTGDPAFRHRPKPAVGGEGAVPIEMQSLSFPDWKGRVRVASKAEKALDALLEERVRFGTMAHELLADVADAADVEEAVRRFAATAEADADTLERLASLARQAVSHPDTARFFAPGLKVKNECELCDSEGLCRPDRVVFADGETWVVDFKTGADEGGEHDRQVMRYCKAINEMGFPKVGGWLIYLLPEIKVRRVC